MARMGKLCVLYKRPGQRALINHAGQVMVRPNFMEVNIQRRLFGSSLNDHLTRHYRASLCAVLTAGKAQNASHPVWSCKASLVHWHMSHACFSLECHQTNLWSRLLVMSFAAARNAQTCTKNYLLALISRCAHHAL